LFLFVFKGLVAFFLGGLVRPYAFTYFAHPPLPPAQTIPRSQI
jgi:hypothetical protein